MISLSVENGRKQQTYSKSAMTTHPGGHIRTKCLIVSHESWGDSWEFEWDNMEKLINGSGNKIWNDLDGNSVANLSTFSRYLARFLGQLQRLFFKDSSPIPERYQQAGRHQADF